MINVQTLNLVGFVSQATFALTMGMLAWSDRRSRGMTWLASASAMQLVATASRHLLRAEGTRVADTVGSCLLVLIFFCAYMGLRWFVVRRELRTSWGPGLTAAAIILVVAVSSFSPTLGVAISRLAVVGTMLVTIEMLWITQLPALRSAARLCALQLAIVVVVMLFRFGVDQFHHGARHEALSTYGREATLIAVSMLSFSFIGLFVAEGKRRLYDETRTDALTGLCNRRAVEEYAEEAIRQANEEGTGLALLMLDLDNFKILNDTWGHWLGDRALHALGSVLLTGTGTAEISARMGGEEFAVLLPGRDMADATHVAERLREAIEDLRLSEGDGVARVTVSIGVSVLHQGERNWTDMLRRADKALYKAKREGRNRVVQGDDAIVLPVAEFQSRMRPETVLEDPVRSRADRLQRRAG